MNKPRVSIIGLGKLGTSLIAAYLRRDFSVIGVDIDTDKVNSLKEHIINTRLEATNSTTYAVCNTDATIILVNTPQAVDDPLSLYFVLSACKAIGTALKEKKGYHLVVLSSTVMPGTTGGIVCDTLEHFSGKRCGEDFGLCYHPEFVALGTATRDFLNPDFLLIGEYNRKSGDVLLEALLYLCESNPPVIRTSFINAELAKIAHNCFLITKISFANHWSQICESFPNADIDAVTSVLGLSRSISPQYLRGSVSGVEGPCFPRDVKAWLQLTKQLNIPDDLPYSAKEANWVGSWRLIKMIGEHVAPHSTIGILGLAYKPHIDLALNSLGCELAKLLFCNHAGYQIVVYDPMAMPNVRNLSSNIIFANSLKECVKEADCLVITTAWNEFRRLKSMRHLLKDKVIIDCWRMLDDMGDNYIAIGRGK